MSGGGGGGPTQTTNVNTNVPEYAKPYVMNMLGATQNQLFNTTPGANGEPGEITGFKPYTPYSTDPTKYFAGPSSLQQSAYGAAGQLQAPNQYQTGTQLATAAGVGGLGAQGQAQGLMGSALGYGAAGAGYGQAGQLYGAQGAAEAQRAAQQAQQAAGMYGAQGAMAGMQGQLAAQRAAQQAQRSAGMYGQQGAMYGAQAANLAPAAQGYGQGAANIGMQGLGYGAQGAGYGQQAANMAGMGFGAGQQYASQVTSPSAVSQYMSPYQQAVTDVAKTAAVREAQMADTAGKLASARSGTYGGARQALMSAEREKNLLSNLSNIQAQGSQAAYDKAIAAQQFGANLGLQGLQAGYQGLSQGMQGAQTGLSGLGTAMQGQQAGLAGLQQAGSLYGQGMQGAQAGLSGVGQQLAAGQLGLSGAQAGMQGAGVGLSGVGQQLAGGQLGLQGTAQGIQGAQAGMQGAGVGLSGVQGALGAGQYGLQGLSAANAAAGTLGQLGTSQQAADINAINLQNQLGSQQQAYQQNIINQQIQDYATAQQYPMMQLGFMSNMLRGLPMQATSTQTYQAAPSPISQLGGLGATALGAYGAAGGFKAAKGGMVPGYKQGGSVQAFQGGDLVSQEVNSETVADLVRSLSQYPAERLKQIATTNPSDTVRRVAKELYDRKVGTQQPTQSEGIASAAIPSFDTFNAASGGIVAFAGNTEDGSLVDEEELRKKYNIQPGGALDITGNYLGYLQSKGFGQQTPENKAIAQNIADIRKNLGENYDDKNLWRAVMAGGIGAMKGKSQYALSNIGEGLESGLGTYMKGEARKEDLLNKLRTGEIDLAKLTTSERNNLLHYATSAVSADEAAKMRLEGVKHNAALRGIEAGKRQDARDETARNREETQIREWTKIFLGSGNTNPSEDQVIAARKKAELQVRGNPLNLPRS